ncbi:MAG: transcriptional regulator [Saprospiraceae bacterium]|nr:transcriptional regulator [Saprospiraceae bacterium]
MEYLECKQKFLDTWGRLGPQWGINKTMAQIHALLLISVEPLNVEQVFLELKISKGNAHMNIKTLMDWGLIYKDCREGCRCEYYVAEKNLHQIFKQILIHRKKRELDPILEELDEIVACTEKCEKSKEFRKMLVELKDFTYKADHALELLTRTDSHWFYNTLMKML